MATPKDKPRLSLRDQRRVVGIAAAVVLAVVFYWQFLSNGLPVWWGPTASAADKAAGRELFEHEWAANDPKAHGDGLGPVFNAKSCVFCHFQGGVGGGGEVAHNATHYEILPRPDKNDYMVGVLHDQSVTSEDRESLKRLQMMYPVVKNPPAPAPLPGSHCSYIAPPTPPFDPVRTHDVQSTALFGVGWLDRISPKAVAANYRRRSASTTFQELKLNFDQIPVGRLPTLADGRIGKFGWKGNFATLEEFVAAACANELGLGTPYSTQAKPFHKLESPDVKPDLDSRQFRELMAFVDTLPRPVEVSNSTSEQGKQVFKDVGCAACHVPDMGGVAGVYSDFLLYALEERSASGQFDRYGPEPPPGSGRPGHVPDPQQWKTPPLWGVADSAPYLHDGRAPTLSAAIQAHRGDAMGVLAAYQKLPAGDQVAVVKFLESLKAPPDAIPVATKSNKHRRLAQR